MEQKIRKIMCCCGNGVGTSLLMQMTVEEALENLGMEEIEVAFGTTSSISEEQADLFVVSEEVVDSIDGVPVIGLEDLTDEEEAAEKIKEFLEMDD